MTSYRLHARFATALVACTAMAELASALPPAYHVTDLGYLGSLSQQFSEGYGINASGQVVGSAGMDEGTSHAFLWTPTTPNGISGTMHDLGTLGASIDFGSGASGINDSGQVTGRSDVSVLSTEHHAFLWTPSTPNGSIGTMIDLGATGEYTYGVGVNDSGQVTGSGHNSFLWAPTTPGADTGQWIDWNALNAMPGTGFGINVSGQVTGLFDTPTGSLHAFLWTPTTPNANTGMLHDLGTLGGATSQGFAINATGQVIGRASTADESLHAFLWTPATPNGATGEMHDLGTLGAGGSVALAINDHGSIVGVSEGLDALGRAFVFSSADGMVDLNSLIDPRSGWILQTANAINNAGQITGYGDHDGVRRAFLLTPVPEPATSVLWGIGGLALALSIRSRALRPRSRTSRGTHQRCALAALTTIVLVNACMDRAAADLVGPTPYLQASDSPFVAYTFDYFHLEDFEDGLLNVPGVIKSAGNIIGPGPAADSVDADDGTIDGSGNGGRSLFVVGEPLNFTFDAIALGRLPTHVGIVRTDGGNAALGGVASFEAFGPGMISLGTIGPVPFGDGVSNGTTAEDRFFGWFDPNGILAVRMPSGVFEVDHLQYGAAVPEPSAAALLVCTFAVFGIYKLRKAALRVGFARMSLYAIAALLCRSPTAGASDFVIDQQHYPANNINEIGLCCGAWPFGQEFTPAFNTLDTVDLLLDGFRSDLFLNIREETITGSIIRSSANTVQTAEKGPVGRFVQFQFEPPVSLLPDETYVIEIVSPVEIVPPQVYVVNDGGWQHRDEHRYTRGRMISGGVSSEVSDIAFRTGSRRLGGTVYESGFEYTEPLYFIPGPIALQYRDWRSVGAVDAVTISALQPSEWPNGGQAIQIKGTGLVPVAGILNAAAIRSSNLEPIANANPIVFMQASVRLDGRSTSANGGSSDDLISANLGVTDGAGSTIAELILSSNGNAYAFAGEHTYSFATPTTIGEYHTFGLRFDYIARRTEFFVDDLRLGALPFAANIQPRFGEPFLGLAAVDDSRLDPAQYNAWFDDFSIRQSPVPEPATVFLPGLAAASISVSLRWRRLGLAMKRFRTVRRSKPLQLNLIAATCISAWCVRADALEPVFAGLGDLPGGSFHSRAHGISADGSVVVGAASAGSDDQAFRWTAESGMVGLGGPQIATDVSADGSVIVGQWGSQAFRWTYETGPIGLGDFPGGAFRSYANAVSADGSSVAGIGWAEFCTRGCRNIWPPFRWTQAGMQRVTMPIEPRFDVSLPMDISADGSVIVAGRGEAQRWTEETGAVTLGDLPGGTAGSWAHGVSADGGVIVGQGNSGAGAEAFRWTESAGMEGLGILPGFDFSLAQDVSADGSVVVGSVGLGATTHAAAFIWDSTSGMRNLRDVLIADFDLGASLVGWTLNHVSAISADGQVLVGYGTNPNGDTEAWMARLGDRASLAGDFNSDGSVDSADYVVWRKNDGTPSGYSAWRANFNREPAETRSAGSGGALRSAEPLSAAVPEPRTCTFVAWSLFLIVCQRRRRR